MDILDCIIIGGGPGGLTAGIYLQRYQRKILLLDNGLSRAATIPLSHNYPGFPHGIKGTQLLLRLKEQYYRYGGTICQDTVTRIRKLKSGYLVVGLTSRFHCKMIILATGATDIEPCLPNLQHAVREGLIRHCPICDGYEVRNKRIAIIGNAKKGVQEALFLRTYSSFIDLFTLGEEPLYSMPKLSLLKRLGIRIVTCGVMNVQLSHSKIKSLTTVDNCTYKFDALYSALGSIINSKLAIKLGAKSAEQYLLVNSHQETNIKGLFAVGDVVKGLSQISVATGGAAVAATEIHNRLLREEQERRR